MDEEFWDFPTIGPERPNIYHRCKYCKRTVPAINYRLSGHYSDCPWANMVENLLKGVEILCVPNWNDYVFEYLMNGQIYVYDQPMELQEVCVKKLGMTAEQYKNIMEEGGILK